MEVTSNEITVTTTSESKLQAIDFENIPLGRAFTDHMFVCEYNNGHWENPRVEPLAMIPTHPAAMALHYGQAIFEGMKATVDEHNTPLLFRPYKNAERLNFSARRMGMPELPEELFVTALKTLVKTEQAWIPAKKGSALYLRPFMYADEPFIGMRAATSYKFIIIASPAGPFFSKPIKLFAEPSYIRAANGGTGEAKAAGNYAAAIRPTELAKSKGYDQVLWLDAQERSYIQEVGTMNIFFKIDDVFITPSLDGAILNGVTRLSVIDLLKHKGYDVIQRRIKIEEVFEAAQNGSLKEAFGTGTAVGIAFIEQIGWNDTVVNLPEQRPITEWVNSELNNIKTGVSQDIFNWMVPVK